MKIKKNGLALPCEAPTNAETYSMLFQIMGFVNLFLVNKGGRDA